MILAAYLPATSLLPPLPSKRNIQFTDICPSTYALRSSPRFISSFRCRCGSEFEKEAADEINEGFSALPPDIPWEEGSTWSTFAIYMFSLHIPLGIGGLSLAAYVLQKPVLDPETATVSLLIVQILELVGTLLLLNNAASHEHQLLNYFQVQRSDNHRNWVLASVSGFGFLILLMFLTSLVAGQLDLSTAAEDPTVKQILQSSNTSKALCAIVYCITTPLLEEVVYRRFLLTSLASRTNWQQAVILSSAAFSAAHFSAENFVQLFIVGCVLGCCYTWSGKLSSSIAVHALYNATILIMTTFLP
ncbi:hypothetical protein LINPERHAP1_LOCUS37407 [Linum perenne]